MKERETFESRKDLVRKFLQEHDYQGASEVDAAFEASRSWFLDVYHREQRTPVVHERLTWVFTHLGITVDRTALEVLSRQFEEMGLMLDPRLTDNLAPVLEQLSRDYLLGIVSDTGYTPGRVLRKHMKKHGVLEYFSAFSFSDETGRAKPHAHQFENVLTKLGIETDRAIHCGDLPSHDVRGAKALGITSILYTGCHTEAANGYEPDFVIADWRELTPIVNKVFA